MDTAMTALTAAPAMATPIIELKKRARMMASLLPSIDVTAMGPRHRRLPLWRPWLPDQDRVLAQRALLPCAVHAAAPGGRNFLRGSAARYRFCSPGRSA